MKSVDSSLYDKNYFERSISTTLDVIKSGDSPIHNTILGLLPLDPGDTVVDFGCGTGILSFLLHRRYGCSVIGIDYSADAIDMGRKYNEKLGYEKVTFTHSDIEGLPALNGIKAVYLSDVVEHLYDSEIDRFFDKLNEWNRGGGKKEELFVIVHTDNTLYLRFIRPLVDFINIITKRSTFDQLAARNKFERERHVNLTCVQKLTRTMKRKGYYLAKIVYPEISDKALKNQLGYIGEFKLTKYLIKAFYPLARPLSPSFYALYHRI